jgi:hypothetical protein
MGLTAYHSLLHLAALRLGLILLLHGSTLAGETELDQAIHLGPIPTPQVTVTGKQHAADSYSDGALRALSED